MAIKFYTEVEKVEQKTERRYHPGTWTEAKGAAQVAYDNISLGYYLHLRGSHEALFVGMEEPEFKTGDKVSVLVQRV